MTGTNIAFLRTQDHSEVITCMLEILANSFRNLGQKLIPAHPILHGSEAIIATTVRGKGAEGVLVMAGIKAGRGGG